MEHFDYLIVGCGVVGCAVAREITLATAAKKRVCVVDKEMEPVSEASSGNTGHIASFFYYTSERAPIEYAMTRRCRELNREWFAAQENVLSCKRGLLLLAFSQEALDEGRKMAEIGRDNGETEIRVLSPEEVFELEPGLRPEARRIFGAVFSPDEYLADTWLLAMSYLYSALEAGCSLKLGERITSTSYDEPKSVWQVRIVGAGDKTQTLTAGVIINCGGNYSDEVHEMLTGEKNAFKIRPAKGSFVVFENDDDKELLVRNMVAPLPSKTTAGVYSFTSLYGNVVVGPTCELQESKTDRSCSAETERELIDHGFDLFPSLRGRRLLKTFSGLRPACADRERHNDYQIKFDPRGRWATLGGIRSTGASTSRALAELVRERLVSSSERVRVDATPPMPKPLSLGDGRVEIGKYRFRPTHPLTQTGIQLMERKA